MTPTHRRLSQVPEQELRAYVEHGAELWTIVQRAYRHDQRRLGHARTRRITGLSERRANRVRCMVEANGPPAFLDGSDPLVAWEREWAEPGTPRPVPSERVQAALASPKGGTALTDPDASTRPVDALEAIRDEDAEDEEPIEELIERRVKVFRRTRRKHEAGKIHRVRVGLPGPIGLVMFGDPHLDDDGCDWDELLRWLDVVEATVGAYAGNIGDTGNVWIGGLMRKWAEQATTELEGIRLIRWFFQRIGWLLVLLGNHDMWRTYGHLLRELARDCDIQIMEPHGTKVVLETPSGQQFRIHARHDFPGRSMWNDAHGPNRAALMDPWADIYIAGHIHSRAQMQSEHPDGRPYWAIRVRGFKRADEYADKLGHYEHEHGAACMLILDPDAAPTERVRVIWDPDEAAATLTWLRARRGYGEAA